MPAPNGEKSQISKILIAFHSNSHALGCHSAPLILATLSNVIYDINMGKYSHGYTSLFSCDGDGKIVASPARGENPMCSHLRCSDAITTTETSHKKIAKIFKIIDWFSHHRAQATRQFAEKSLV